MSAPGTPPPVKPLGGGSSAYSTTPRTTTRTRGRILSSLEDTDGTSSPCSRHKSMGGSGQHGTPRTHCEKMALGITERAVDVGESTGKTGASSMNLLTSHPPPSRTTSLHT